jgi:hypothetical protein
MKHPLKMVKNGDLATWSLPAGWTLRLENGQAVCPSEIVSHNLAGRSVEILHEGSHVGWFRSATEGEFVRHAKAKGWKGFGSG